MIFFVLGLLLFILIFGAWMVMNRGAKRGS